MRRLIVGLAAVVALAGVACSTDPGAVVKNADAPAEELAVQVNTAFLAMTAEQQSAFCTDVVVKGEVYAANKLYLGLPSDVQSNADVGDLAIAIASVAYNNCVARHEAGV